MGRLYGTGEGKSEDLPAERSHISVAKDMCTETGFMDKQGNPGSLDFLMVQEKKLLDANYKGGSCESFSFNLFNLHLSAPPYSNCHEKT